MGRTSRAEQIYRSIQGEDGSELEWLVIYNFPDRVSNIFWDNVKRLGDICGDGCLIQRSVFKTCNWKGAFALADLVKFYGGQARIFQVNEYEHILE